MARRENTTWITRRKRLEMRKVLESHAGMFHRGVDSDASCDRSIACEEEYFGAGLAGNGSIKSPALLDSSIFWTLSFFLLRTWRQNKAAAASTKARISTATQSGFGVKAYAIPVISPQSAR